MENLIFPAAACCRQTIQSKHYLQLLSIEKRDTQFRLKKFMPLKKIYIYIYIEKKNQLLNGFISIKKKIIYMFSRVNTFQLN